MYSITCSTLTGKTVSTSYSNLRTKTDARMYIKFLHNAVLDRDCTVVVATPDVLVVSYGNGLGSVYQIVKE